MRDMYTNRPKKLKRTKWVDSRLRFLATVSTLQDSPPLVRLDVVVPTTSLGETSLGETSLGETSLGIVDDLFIPLQEILSLRPYQPRNAMLALDPSLCEVAVNVENFWSLNESGGNSGRAVRRGIVYVSGDVAGLLYLQRENDKFPVGSTGEASGVRGRTHVLEGGINLQRMRTQQMSSSTVFTSRWLCVDYSVTHMSHCPSTPKCSLWPSVVLRPECLHRNNLYLQRQANPTDLTAIALVCIRGTGGHGDVVGFVSPEFARCLAPSIDSGFVTITGRGVYSENDVSGDLRHRVWFRVDGGGGVGPCPGVDLLHNLNAIPWWVVDNNISTA
jgi:hypothetical protein